MKQSVFQTTLIQARQLLADESFERALKLYRKLTRLSPHVAAIWHEYGCAAAGVGQVRLASQAWDRATEISPHDAALLLSVGHGQSGLRQSEKARKNFVAAATADATAINPRISMAVEFERYHDFGAARQWVDQCLAINGHDEQAQYLCAVIDRRESRLEEAERRLRDLVASKPNHSYVMYACRYELAQLLDRRGEYDEAMVHLAEAKRLVGKLADVGEVMKRYDQMAALIRGREESLSRNTLQVWAKSYPENKREPIPPLVFLGGHPRSGTTLLEQVLDVHPRVEAYDESLAFAQTIVPAFERLNSLSSAFINGLRRDYINVLAGRSGAVEDGRILVDKNPSPTAYLPLWLRVFPELRVLIALRDPRDVVLSCYFQNIPLNHINSNFLSFERLAKHYADLMDVWLAVREWEGFVWMETRYEDMVGNLEKEGRRVTEFIGLEWDECQTRFYDKSKTKILYSPTYHDVTRPIYSSSVSRWRAYEKYMAPVLPILEPYCIKLGYS